MGKKSEIREVLSRIIWSDNNLKNYELIIRDGRSTRSIKLESVNKILSDRLIIGNEEEAKVIPLHRIISILRNGEIIWQRRSV